MKYYSIIIICILCMIGCEEQKTAVFEDLFIGLNNNPSSFLYLRDGSGPVSANIQAQLIGAAQSNAINYSFEVLPSSTAIEGTHYTVTSNSGSIPAGSISADLPIMVNPDNFQIGEAVSIAVKIVSADVDIAGFTSEQSYNAEITCNNSIPTDKTWTVTVVGGFFGVTGSRDDVTITDNGDGNLLISDITAGLLPSLGCCDEDEAVIIANVCDVIRIVGPGTTASFGYETNAGAGYGEGSWDPATQVLILPWWEPANGFGAVVEFVPNN